MEKIYSLISLQFKFLYPVYLRKRKTIYTISRISKNSNLYMYINIKIKFKSEHELSNVLKKNTKAITC